MNSFPHKDENISKNEQRKENDTRLNPLVYGQNFSIVSLHWVVNSLLLTLKISQNKQNSSWNSI